MVADCRIMLRAAGCMTDRLRCAGAQPSRRSGSQASLDHLHKLIEQILAGDNEVGVEMLPAHMQNFHHARRSGPTESASAAARSDRFSPLPTAIPTAMATATSPAIASEICWQLPRVAVKAQDEGILSADAFYFRHGGGGRLCARIRRIRIFQNVGHKAVENVIKP